MKKFLYFILYLSPWFLSSLLFSSYSEYFNSLNLPWFALPQVLYGIVWTILYILIAISVTIIYDKNNRKYIKSYNQALISNYIFNQLYIFFMFFLKSPFLGFVDSVAIFITSLFLYYETKELDDTASKFLLPYVFFSLYAMILSLAIYFMNF